jgi:metallophosphoesterase superfamily enzyme
LQISSVRHCADSCLIAVVGDPHGCWDSGDEDAITGLNPDALVCVGDIDDEDPKLVRRLADFAHRSLPGKAAVLLGNHDARCTSVLVCTGVW